ncbi:unnamed protein product [Clavelina lepadiformis]|uniref:Uncharacterized protein n=1 Tax=Clavelina lepadiformis TaxID=159417 RepID=A0ABP0FJJ4_CLALP
MVCRCCCQSDACNIGPHQCFGRQPVRACRPRHRPPIPGSVDCSSRNRVGSACTFSCPDGYNLVGSVTSTCNDDGTWSSLAPRCAQALCNPPHISLRNGAISCSRRNILNSVCTFSCDPGFTLNGARTSTCQPNGFEAADWSTNTPTGPRETSCNRTRTGQAINFTREVILAEGHGHRPSARDLVVVLTDGRSQDDVAIPSQLLRDEGALTYAIGIRPEGARVDFNIEDDLLSIAGAGDRYFFVDGGFSSLNDAFAIEITEQICRDPCDLVGLNED